MTTLNEQFTRITSAVCFFQVILIDHVPVSGYTMLHSAEMSFLATKQMKNRREIGSIVWAK